MTSNQSHTSTSTKRTAPAHRPAAVKSRVCSCGCKAPYIPVRDNQRYATRQCAERAKQRRWRARAKAALAIVKQHEAQSGPE